MRFSAVLLRLAAALATAAPADLNIVRRAYRAAVDAFEKARLLPNGAGTIFDFHAFAHAFPPALLPFANEFRQACSEEANKRPAPWAANHLADAIENFCPTLLEPLQSTKAEKAEATAVATATKAKPKAKPAKVAKVAAVPKSDATA